MVHAYYCNFKSPSKRAFHDFLDSVRLNRVTLTFKVVTSFYVFFLSVISIFYLFNIVANLGVPNYVFLIFLIFFILSYPVAYLQYRIRFFEPVHEISVKLLTQSQVKAMPSKDVLDHQDILKIGLVEVSKVIDYLIILEKQSQALAEGKFEDGVHNQHVDGSLGDSFKKMREVLIANLRSLIDDVKISADQVLEQSNKVSESTSQVNSSLEQISGVVQEIAKGAQDMSKQANNIQALSKKTSNRANDGIEASKNLEVVMNNIKLGTNESVDKIKSLEERSKKIGNIVNVISSISDQTNLLALNAAIEAARAGDAGRGFAVVADEVRKLAEQTQKATKEISELISSITSDINTATLSVQNNTKKVDESLIEVNKTSAIFNEIPVLVGEVDKAITEMAAVVEENAAGSQETSASVEEISASLNEVKNSIDLLKASSKDLFNSVSKMKL